MESSPRPIEHGMGPEHEHIGDLKYVREQLCKSALYNAECACIHIPYMHTAYSFQHTEGGFQSKLVE